MSRPHVLAPATGLNSLPDVVIGQVSSFLQFEDVARLLKVSTSIQETVYASETVLVFPKKNLRNSDFVPGSHLRFQSGGFW